MVAGGPPVQPEAEPVDLMDPFYALAVDPAQLCVLSDNKKSMLRFNIKNFRRELWDQFSQEQRWAFNADAVPIPIRNRSATSGPSIYHVVHSTNKTGTRVHLSSSAKDRWYVIVKGRGFTGIARGVDFYVAAVTGVPRAFSEKAASKSEAEVLWLKYYANGVTEILPEATPRQSPVPGPVATASTIRSARPRAPVPTAGAGPSQPVVIELDSDSDEERYWADDSLGEHVAVSLTHDGQSGESADQEMD
jgi:hypothetical protein